MITELVRGYGRGVVAPGDMSSFFISSDDEGDPGRGAAQEDKAVKVAEEEILRAALELELEEEEGTVGGITPGLVSLEEVILTKPPDVRRELMDAGPALAEERPPLAGGTDDERKPKRTGAEDIQTQQAGSEEATTPLGATNTCPAKRIPVAVHPHVECDVCGMHPIVGQRYKKRGKNYDLCEADYLKLQSNSEREQYEVLAHKRSKLDKWMDPETKQLYDAEFPQDDVVKASEDEENGVACGTGDTKDSNASTAVDDPDVTRVDANGVVWKPCYLKGIIRFVYTPGSVEKARGEIAVRPGDRVIILERTKDNQYFRGSVMIFGSVAATGVFPSNFVEVTEMLDKPPELLTRFHNSTLSSQGLPDAEAFPAGMMTEEQIQALQRAGTNPTCCGKLLLCAKWAGSCCCNFGRCLFRCCRCCVTLEWLTAERCPCLFNLFSRPTWNVLRPRVYVFTVALAPVVAFLTMCAMYVEGHFDSAAAGWARVALFSPMVVFFLGWLLVALRSLTLSYDPQFFGGSRVIKRLFYATLWCAVLIMLTFVVLFAGAAFHPAPASSTPIAGGEADALGRIMAPVFVVVFLVWTLFCLLSARLCVREGGQNANIGGSIVVQVMGCCLVALLATQGALALAKLQGFATFTWRVAFTPLWILDSIAACITCIVVVAVCRDDDLHNPSVANLYAIVGAWCLTFFPLAMTEILFCAYADGGPVRPFGVVVPFWATWGMLVFVALVDSAYLGVAFCKSVLRRCRERRDRMAKIKARLQARIIFGPDAIVAIGKKNVPFAAVTKPTAEMDPPAESLETGRPKEDPEAVGTPIEDPANLTSLEQGEYERRSPEEVAIDSLLIDALAAMTTSSLDASFREILKLARAHPHLQEGAMYRTLLSFGAAYRGRLREIGDSWTWTTSSAQLYGDLLRVTRGLE